MNRTKTARLIVALAGLSLSAVGCQTWMVGQSLPSPYHRRDDVQYFPKGPSFPHQNELNQMAQYEDELRRNN